MADPLRYFRAEAREILEQLQSGLLELERGQTSVESVARLLRLGHTLKGAARVVKQPEIANLAHQLEELLLPFRDGEHLPAREQGERLLGVVDGIAQHVRALTKAPEPAATGPLIATEGAKTPAATPAAASDEAFRAAPLEHVETVMDGVSELGFQLSSLRHALPQLEQSRNLAEQLAERLDPRHQTSASEAGALRAMAGELLSRLTRMEREMSTSVDRATRELAQVRDRVEQLRLVAAASMFGTLERATRDAAMSLGKRAVFEARGGEVRLDAGVLGAVQRALVQGVRNAVAHGIEPSAERSARGKPSLGRVQLEVARRGRHINFVCRDDGQGVNLPQVQREAERLGKLGQAASKPTPDDLLSLLLHGGITTSQGVSELAGRGLGLDLIREALAGVGGTVTLRTEPGQGTSLELTVPASLSALDALVVEAGGAQCAIPLVAVVQAQRLATAQLSRSADSLSLAFEGQEVPFVPLALLLRGSQDRERPRDAWSAVIVRGQAGLLALGVDRLLGAESLVARTLPDAVEVDATVTGVTLDADGHPRLLLDPDGLLAAASRTAGAATPVELQQRVILVIDDSLTTRMLEQSILESAGYAVDLAISGQEGLEKALARRYDLLLVDVEMPGMDGFTFIERVRADPRLAATPAVLVTSRAAPADRARGRAAGASGHIDKGEFEQQAFLEQIGRLMR